jgi:hypothetical protein
MQLPIVVLILKVPAYSKWSTYEKWVYQKCPVTVQAWSGAGYVCTLQSHALFSALSGHMVYESVKGTHSSMGAGSSESNYSLKFLYLARMDGSSCY